MSDIVESRRPDYPPKTPPPPKRPVVPERPQPDSTPVPKASRAAGARLPTMTLRNRQTVALPYRSDPWAAAKAAARAVEVVRQWKYDRLDAADLEAAVRLLVGLAVADGGKRVSVHLADQDRKIVVAVLSHVTDPAPNGRVLVELAALRSVDACGTDAGAEGRRTWALLDTVPKKTRKAA